MVLATGFLGCARVVAYALVTALYHQLMLAAGQSTSSLLPTGTVSAAAPGTVAQLAAPAAPVQILPTAVRTNNGQCTAVFAAGQQCGGNMTSVVAGCSDFNSCMNTQWAGACCPAQVSCKAMESSGGYCWACGGRPPQNLVTASRTATDAPAPMCTRQTNGDFDYGCVLGASMMFYEAQRSGKLPTSNRVPWRGDSALLDKAPNGASIVGGWYDAGDLTRFTFPAAYTISTLALGFLEFPDAYQASGQVDHMLGNLKWGADWLMAARYQPDALVAVTWMPGAGVNASHRFWGRPEDVPGAAMVRALTSPMKGADLLAQAAAALAAVSVAFQDRDPVYSSELLDAAQGLYVQATLEESAGLYSNSIPEVRGYYTSYSYIDDLAWAAAWLAVRTGDQDTLREAKFYYDQHMTVEGGGEGRRFDYNNLIQGVGYLMAKLDPGAKDKYMNPIREVMNLWLTASSNITYTPKGMAYIDSWGNLRYVANQAFMGLLHNKMYPDQTQRATVYACFARKQARIMLGETGESYVVGIGTNPPCRPHHRGASCIATSDPDQPCDCSAYFNPGCNPNTIYGALVGGPNQNDEFTDTRWDYQSAEVALDWNAGFTGMLAGLSESKVSWDQCKAAGMENGRGVVSAASVRLRVGVWWHWLLLAAAGLWMLSLQ